MKGKGRKGKERKETHLKGDGQAEGRECVMIGKERREQV